VKETCRVQTPPALLERMLEKKSPSSMHIRPRLQLCTEQHDPGPSQQCWNTLRVIYVVWKLILCVVILFVFRALWARKILLCALFGSQNFTLRTFWLAKFYSAHFLARKMYFFCLLRRVRTPAGFNPSFLRKIAPERGFAHKNWIATFFIAHFLARGVCTLRTFWLAIFYLT
jgi:hypothetical protein